MIQPQDLRRGNRVMYNGNEVYITELKTRYCEISLPDPSTFVEDMGYNAIHPIPLTPDVLERCGFKQTLNSPELYYADIDIFYDMFSYSWNNYDINKKCLMIGYFNNEFPCQYLHQLQNLVYSLCGKELTISNAP